jgi:hypothetical protein
VSEHEERAEEPTTDQSGALEEDGVAELTGLEAVDGVLRSLETLEGRPVDEHVAVFESAHETLRAALANAGGPTAG